MKRLLLRALVLTACATAKETPMSTSTMKSGYAPVNGLQLYYEIRGAGDPLVVLHGAFGSTENLTPDLEGLAKTRRVIAVDLQGHGRTADVDRAMTCQAMADDVGALIAHLGLPQVDVLGYSLGGGVAIQTGLRHRDRVRKLVVVSMAFARRAVFPEVIAGFDAIGAQLAEVMKPSPIYQTYQKVAPRPQDFPRLLDKVGALVKQDYDWTAEIGKLPPTLLVAADADYYPLSHVLEVYAALGGSAKDPGWDGSAGRSASQLAILPGTSHYDILMSPQLVPVVQRWLERP
ncbi:MAG TPA: alpha/beta hydrolase [Haliangiales bacterium]|nr:alpha/beta hydrolase [Haliangiales bacterium]